MKKSIIILWFASIAIFIISKLLGGTFFVSSFLAISIPLLFKLSQIKWKAKTFATIWWLILIFIDFLFIILLFVPTKSYQIDVKDYYKKKENYAKIFFKDWPNDAKRLVLIIKNNWKIRKSVKVSDYIKTNKKEKILLKEWDKIYFLCTKKKYCHVYKSFVAIYLWDDSILRITPWTIINLNKVTKNLDNLSESKTNIWVEKWNLWFHVIRLIKDSNSMQIETWKGQTLIIRWTAGFVNKTKEETYAIDYSHFIEVKNKKESKILKAGEWAEITEEYIKIKNIDEILKKIWISKDFLKELDKLDKKYIQQSLQNLNNYIKSIQHKTSWLIWKLEELKLKTFSIWDTEYKKYLENLETYKYLIWETKKLTSNLINNPNLAFLASNLEKTEVKIWYLYQQLQKNIKNSDLYKTYIINLWINWKIKDVNSAIQKGINNIDWIINTDQLNNMINNFNF